MRNLAYLFAVASCARTTPAAPPLTGSAPAASVMPTTPQLLTTLERLLERDGLTVDEVVGAVGTVETDPGIPLPITLKPTAAALAFARLALDPSGAEVYMLELAFTNVARPTLQELRAVFGEDQLGRGFHGERFTIFYPKSKSTHWSIAVIASMSSCFDPHSHAEPTGPCEEMVPESRIESVSFRRDPS